MLDKAIQKNCVLFLPTGSGKTYIAAMLIKELSRSTETPYSSGGFRSVFLAPTVPLVEQQYKYLEIHTSVKLNYYCGSKVINNKILDHWDKNIWDKEIENNQLLIMTPKILVDLIQHSFLG